MSVLSAELETIALDQVDIIERLVKINRELITELSQHRKVDAEERELELIVQRTGGGGT